MNDGCDSEYSMRINNHRFVLADSVVARWASYTQYEGAISKMESKSETEEEIARVLHGFYEGKGKGKVVQI